MIRALLCHLARVQRENLERERLAADVEVRTTALVARDVARHAFARAGLDARRALDGLVVGAVVMSRIMGVDREVFLHMIARAYVAAVNVGPINTTVEEYTSDDGDQLS